MKISILAINTWVEIAHLISEVLLEWNMDQTRFDWKQRKHKKRKSKTETSKTDGKILFCRESKKTQLGVVMHSYIQGVFNK